MRRALSAQEIAELDENSGPVGQSASYVESVFVIDEDNSEGRSRRYELRVKGVTGTFCGECFSVDVTETGPDSCLIEWSVRMPNGRKLSLYIERWDCGLLELKTLQHAFRHLAARAIGWGETFRNIVPAEMAEAVTDIADAVRSIKHQLQAVEPHARELPADARTALDEALRAAESLPSRIAALEELVARIKPVKHPRN